MELPYSISSLSSTTSLSSSFSSTSSSSVFDLPHTWIPPPPLSKASAAQPKMPAVEFWFEEDGDEPEPADRVAVGGIFFENCRLCRRQLAAGHAAYVCAGVEVAFCREDCRRIWMQMEETFCS
ncbi:hypothetical protein KSP40_PGU014481 [Platanthera guangdongensis]|uniref:FLZ-type domain-containing protein n=1 Tax=Platanthera guangdongensis TaxID=2320717 RepID=A0ABR2MR99_9ASPA